MAIGPDRNFVCPHGIVGGYCSFCAKKAADDIEAMLKKQKSSTEAFAQQAQIAQQNEVIYKLRVENAELRGRVTAQSEFIHKLTEAKR